MRLEGLSDMQNDLLRVAQRDLPREMPKVMRKVGSKARTKVAKKARSLVKKKTGLYHKKWKRGKVFRGSNGEWVVRVVNSSPHAHLIEDGHRQVTEDGQVIGFVSGKKPLDKGMREFEASGETEEIIGDWIDRLLRDARL